MTQTASAPKPHVRHSTVHRQRLPAGARVPVAGKVASSIPEATLAASDRMTYPDELFWFDKEWYVAMYPDVGLLGIDAAQHYLDHGWLESRNPNPFFDTRAYLEANPDVANVGVNPFIHFIMYGATERRPLRPGVGVKKK